MDDRQLLEDAARAAGIAVEFSIFSDGSFFCFKAGGDCFNDDWNPLNDDGDALRLAVKLKLAIYIAEDVTQVDPHQAGVAWGRGDHNSDPHAATRRAIVRAAAAIGRQREAE